MIEVDRVLRFVVPDLLVHVAPGDTDEDEQLALLTAQAHAHVRLLYMWPETVAKRHLLMSGAELRCPLSKTEF